MNRLLLTRHTTGDQGTFGKLQLPPELHGLVLATGELPVRGNLAEHSCIPAGIYRCLWTHSPKFGFSTYELQDVPGRTAIRIHSANFCGDRDLGWQAQVEGCIALGLAIDPMMNKLNRLQTAVRQSRDAVAQFENELQQEPFEIEIVEAFG